MRLHCQHQTGANDLIVHAHGTGAAYPMFTADMRSGQMQMLTQEVREVQSRQNKRIDALPVDVERNGHRRRHATLAPRSARPRSVETHRTSSTLAKCRRIEAVACWSSWGFSSSPSAADTSAISAGAIAALISLFVVLDSTGRSPTAKNAKRRSVKAPSSTIASAARPVIA